MKRFYENITPFFLIFVYSYIIKLILNILFWGNHLGETTSDLGRYNYYIIIIEILYGEFILKLISFHLSLLKLLSGENI